MGKYDDIINMPHHRSAKRPHMSVHDRAAQFAPFAALTGYGDAIDETRRLTCDRPEPGEAELAELDAALSELLARIGERPQVEATYFVPDEKKEGGAYVTRTGRVRRVDAVRRRLVFDDGTEINVSDLSSLALSDK